MNDGVEGINGGVEVETMRAPNRYRKMSPEFSIMNDDGVTINKARAEFWEAKYKKYKHVNSRNEIRALLQEEIRVAMLEEWPQKSWPVGMGYSFDIYDEVLIWGKDHLIPWPDTFGFFVLGGLCPCNVHAMRK